jgi:DNA-directed RNA polymerase specialized sigma24 family protein
MENPMADIEQVEQIEDPLERAREVGRRMAQIPLAHARLARIRREAVLQLRTQGMSYADIGRELQLHRNRIQKIAEAGKLDEQEAANDE